VKVPSYTQIRDIISPITGSSWRAEPFAVQSGGYDFGIEAMGRGGDTITTILPNGTMLMVAVNTKEASNFRFFGQRGGQTWFTVFLGPDRDHLAKVTGDRLTDTAELARIPSVTRLTKIVEAAFTALLAAGPAMTVARQQQDTDREQIEVDRITAKQEHARPRLVHLIEFGQAQDLAVICHPNQPGADGSEIGSKRDGVWLTVKDYERRVYAYFPSPDPSASVSDAVSFVLSLHYASREAKQPTPASANLSGEGFHARFDNTAQITEPGLRGLAVVMLEAWNDVRAEAEERAVAKNVVAETTRMATLNDLLAGTPATMQIRIRLEERPLSQPIPFVQLADGSWASDAIVAVRRGPSGRKVYAEAIRLPADRRLSGSGSETVSVTAANLRDLYNLPATILGWNERVPWQRAGGVGLTADSNLWDHDWVTELTRPKIAASV
jgi:hypothetical protein